MLDLAGRDRDRLNAKRVDEIKARLDKLNNMGNTPLYRAIMEAVDQLNSDRESVQKQIIVMTDGVNDQRHAEFRNTCEQLREKLNTPGNHGIRLDIVGFQIKASELTAEEKKEYNEMMGLVSELKRDGRGEFFDANDHDGLLAALRKSLALSKYEVFRAKSMTRVSRPLELNKVCEIKPLTPGPFHVQLVDATRPAAADVVLEGGEAIELFLQQNPWGLVHRRYDRAVRDSCDRIADPADPDRAATGSPLTCPSGKPARSTSTSPCKTGTQLVSALGPSRPGRRSRRCRSRPTRARPEKYVYYDMAFEADRPVPVLQYRAPDWPKQAEEAQIELWCKFRPTIEEEVALGKLKQFHVSDVPDVHFDVATVRGQGRGGLQDRDQRMASQGCRPLPPEARAFGGRSGPRRSPSPFRHPGRRSRPGAARVLPGGQSVLVRDRWLHRSHRFAQGACSRVP